MQHPSGKLVVAKGSDEDSSGMQVTQQDEEGLSLRDEDTSGTQLQQSSNAQSNNQGTVQMQEIVASHDMAGRAWGPFRFTWKKPAEDNPLGSYEARCPYHKKNTGTGCKQMHQYYLFWTLMTNLWP